MDDNERQRQNDNEEEREEASGSDSTGGEDNDALDVEMIDLRDAQPADEASSEEEEEVEQEQRHNRVFEALRRMVDLRRRLNAVRHDYRNLLRGDYERFVEEMNEAEDEAANANEEMRNGQRRQFDRMTRTIDAYLFEELHEETSLCEELREGSSQELVYLTTDHILYPGFTIPLIIEDGRMMRCLQNTLTSASGSEQSQSLYVVLLPISHYGDNFEIHLPDFEVPSCEREFEAGEAYAFVAKIQKYRADVNSLKLELDVKYRCTVQGLIHATSGCKAKITISPDICLQPIEKAVCTGNFSKLSSKKRKRLCQELINYPECAIKCNTEENCTKLANLTYVFVNQDDIKKHLEMGVAHFSYWLATNLPIEGRTQYELLKEDSADFRIVKLLSIVKNLASVVCSNEHCGYELCQLNQLIYMNPEGTSGHFVNSHGYVHDMITVSDAKNYRLIGRPTSEYSWFPGYKWTIMNCNGCHRHIGWRFTSKQFLPKQFFGLTRTAFRPRIRENFE